MFSVYSILSIILGVIAIGLPIISLVKINSNYHQVLIFNFLSMAAGAISIYLQIMYTSSLVKIKDWSSIEDTAGGLVIITSILLALVLVLNAVVIGKYLVRYKAFLNSQKQNADTQGSN
ncbi:MAG: hypothetical protein ACOYCB_01330 [Fastidiosipilaceae bacterium]|jgi:hypothetical protein|nr:hypothetical protein [Clostridiaceae bacterium]